MSEAETLVLDPLRRRLRTWREALRRTPVLTPAGRLVRINGLVMEAMGLKLPLGASCRIETPTGGTVEAEVVGFQGDKLFLMPTEEVYGLAPGARVLPPEPPPIALHADEIPEAPSPDRAKHLPAGEALLGRVVDAAGRPLDGKGPIAGAALRPLFAPPINPLARTPIDTPLDVGIRAINALLTVGRGQRLGLFAGSGVGKSVLIGMMARFTVAEVIVVGLIGERGREVKEFIEQNLGPEGLARAVVVAAPADVSPLLRLQGAAYATAIAEQFRDEGRHVLLIMDSLTRYAMAQREIALAVGEPPVTKGYPPSVFARLPALVERTGNGADDQGSITAFYTVLTEGDDPQDPIADAARAILDGHILLSRRIADAGLYPAIDVESSVSRVVQDIADETWRERIRALKRLVAAYNSNRDLIAIGAYQRGNDPVVDEALVRWPEIVGFLGQDVARAADLEHSRGALADLLQRNRAQHKENAA